MRNDKYAALCTELHLGSRKITHLAGFEAFVNLSTLWVNNNRLTVLEGLDTNVRLRNLHAHGNRIRKLEGSSLIEFKFLNQLTLNDNFLENMQDVIEELKPLKHLKSLDLFGNPISQEDNYRLLVIGELPWLKVLDRTPITLAEVKEAKKLVIKLKRAQNMKLTARKEVPDESDKPPVSARTQTLQYALPRLRAAFAAKRVFLERTFLESDPRKVGSIPESEFVRGLKLYGIMNLVTEDELAMISSKYSKDVALPAISSTHTLTKNMVDYRRFCDDVLRSELRVHNRAFDSADVYEMDPVPEISVAAKDLQTYVHKNKTMRREEMERSKREAFLANKTGTDLGNFTFTTTNTTSSFARHGDMDAWNSFQLRKLIVESVLEKKYPGGVPAGTKTPTLAALVAEGGKLDEGAVRDIFHSMQDLGKIPTRSVDECVAGIFAGSKDGMVGLAELRDSLGCGEAPTRASTAPISSGTGGKVSFKNQSSVVVWRNLTSHELEDREGVVFQASADLLDSLLKGANAGGADAQTRQQKLMTMTMQSSITGTRLASTKVFNKTAPPDITPDSVIRTAPNRCDVVVIPSLNSASQRKERDLELRKTHDFDTQLSKLGLSGDALDIAIARKKRSLTSTGSMIVNLKAKGAIEYNPKPSDRPKKGWATSTGTLVFK
jgi:hypothetical protein